MMTGVALGILLGAAIVAVAGVGAWQIVVATAAALLVTTGAGASPVIRIQAAASAILVVALHRPGSDLAVQRLVDALIGGGIAIVLARFLFPVDPLELVRSEATAPAAPAARSLGVAWQELTPRSRTRMRSQQAPCACLANGRLPLPGSRMR
jgi:uncharacterized membrane protein YgaE (UPF0421/DUF939 family)